MKRLIAALALTAAAVPALAADVGVSINIGQPGFYGQIDIGNAPRPVLVQPQPIVIQPAPREVEVRPAYLVVPPGHRRHWKHYCHEYNACGRPVYFVDERWYNDRYVPYYRERHGDRRDDRNYYRRDDRNYDGGDYRERDGGGDQGHGRGHGRGH